MQPTAERTMSDQSAANPIVDVSGCVQRFGGLHALGPIDLTIQPGEFVSIVGPSGCGKSTLLELVAGLQDPAEGQIAVAGEPLRGPRDRTAIAFQESATLPWRTVRDNVAFALEVRGVPKSERRNRADELIRTVGLGGFEDNYPSQLSGGMRQRVAIARCLSMDPDLILADEPFGALDEQTRLLMSFELMRVVEELSCGVLFITHSIQEAVLLSDRVLVMSARPGTVMDEIHVDLPRPRDEHTLASPKMAALTERIWTQLKDEAGKAMEATVR